MLKGVNIYRKNVVINLLVVMVCMISLMYITEKTCYAKWVQIAVSDVAEANLPDYLKEFNNKGTKLKIVSLNKVFIDEHTNKYMATLSDKGESHIAITVTNKMVSAIGLDAPAQDNIYAAEVLAVMLSDSGMSENGFKNFYNNMVQSIREHGSPKVLDRQGDIELQLEGNLVKKDRIFVVVSCWQNIN